MAAGGGKEPNLTPFVDLFSVLICFLLMTAAWTQLEAFQVQLEEKKTTDPEAAAEAPPPPQTEEPKKKVELALNLRANQLMAREDQTEKLFPVRGLDIATPELKAHLAEWRNRFPESQVLVIQSGQQATYGQLIRLYDIVTREGWDKVAISPY